MCLIEFYNRLHLPGLVSAGSKLSARFVAASTTTCFSPSACSDDLTDGRCKTKEDLWADHSEDHNGQSNYRSREKSAAHLL